jgi:hypothetical protein
VALVRTDVSEEPGASFIRGTKIGELGTTQAATSNRRTLRKNTTVFLRSVRRLTPFFIVTAVKTSNITQIYSLYANDARTSQETPMGLRNLLRG